MSMSQQPLALHSAQGPCMVHPARAEFSYVTHPACGVRMSHTMQCDRQALACLLSHLGVLKVRMGTRNIPAACCICAEYSVPMPVHYTMHDVR